MPRVIDSRASTGVGRATVPARSRDGIVRFIGLSGLLQHVPRAVLAGLLVSVGIGIIDGRGFSHIAKVPRSDALLMLFVLVLTCSPI
jgi:hypothetical protein